MLSKLSVPKNINNENDEWLKQCATLLEQPIFADQLLNFLAH